MISIWLSFCTASKYDYAIQTNPPISCKNAISVYHTKIISDSGPYHSVETYLVSDETELDLDQRLMSVHAFSTQSSHPSTRNT